jgi:hypothetical protein
VILNGITAVTFEATMSAEMALSSISVIVYQGTITMFTSLIQAPLSSVEENEVTAIGGVIIMGIDLNFIIANRMRFSAIYFNQHLYP